MPTYDYRCRQCGHQFEYLQSITEDPLKECPRCNGFLDRLIGAGAGLIFKGSGFYATDYRNRPSQNKSGSPSDGAKEATADDGKEEARSETGSKGKRERSTKSGKGE